MTIPTITCDHCESEIDVATDKNCVIYDPSGITAVICKTCRQTEYDKWLADFGAFGTGVTCRGRHVPLSTIKRGWRA